MHKVWALLLLGVTMANIHINIGSNQQREANIVGAIERLKLHFGQITLSDIFESASQGFKGEDFYNIGVNTNTELSVDEVNVILKEIEHQLGRREQSAKFSDRVIDLDLIVYDDLVDEALNLPRNDLTQYNFVAYPLCSINPTFVHPKNLQTCEQILETMKPILSYNYLDILYGE